MASQTPIDERTVSQVWERQAFETRSLASIGLRVLFRGSPSDAGGPDYQDAMLVTRHQILVTGDVEFHVLSTDWFRHGHHRDRRYNNVILHVVWRDEGRPVTREDGAVVPTLELSSCCVPFSGPQSTPLVAHPCVGVYRGLSADQMTAAIQSSARMRFDERADRLAADLTVADADQVLYAALLEACGYASNRQVFRALSEAAPFSWAMGLRGDQRLSGLLAAAGLTESAQSQAPTRLHPSTWRLVRLRPSNHPARRLAGIATLLDRHGPHLADTLTEVVRTAERPGDIRRALQSAGAEGGIGPGRADEMVVSVLLPFVAAYGYPHEAWDAFTRYPAPPSTRWTRHMAAMLAEAGHDVRVRRAVEHQGLHALYHAHCRTERSTGCPACSGAARLVLMEA